ncbi:putative acyltransferase 3 [Plasmopara halstedii]
MWSVLTTKTLPNQKFAFHFSFIRRKTVEMLQNTSSGDSRDEIIHLITIEEGATDQQTLPFSSRADEQQSLDQAESSVSTKSEASECHLAPEHKTKVLFLDGARGLAALLVVVHHSREFMLEMHLPLGAVGVDLFFVLSSYLLTWIFMQKSQKLLAKGASFRTWIFSLADYFQRRFFRVYPLFSVTLIVISLLTDQYQACYFAVNNPGPSLNIAKTLMFDFEYRYFVFWTLPLEIAYYFVIPIFVLVVLGLRRLWWIAGLLLSVWIVNEGLTTYRDDHQPLRPHISTFLTGSVAAVVFIQMDSWIQTTGFVFRWWHTLLLRTVEYLAISMLLSVTFRGLLFTWVIENPMPDLKGAPYSSAFLAIIIVIEMIKPSCVSRMLEWNVLCTWGKFSFSIYLMHTFAVYNPVLMAQTNYFDRLFSRLIVIFALSTTTYYLVEYPSLRLSKRLTKLITSVEQKQTNKWTKLATQELVDQHAKRLDNSNNKSKSK